MNNFMVRPIHPVTDHRPSVRAAAHGRSASACATQHVTGGAAAV
jgi:plasmid stability protein